MILNKKQTELNSNPQSSKVNFKRLNLKQNKKKIAKKILNLNLTLSEDNYKNIELLETLKNFKAYAKLLQRNKYFINYKNLNLLNAFINFEGQIKSRLETGISSYFQRKISKAIKKARTFSLLKSTLNINATIFEEINI